MTDDTGAVVLEPLTELFCCFHNASLEMKVNKVQLCIDMAKVVPKKVALIGLGVVSSVCIYSQGEEIFFLRFGEELKLSFQ